jgi:GntR family transcriptional regulator
MGADEERMRNGAVMAGPLYRQIADDLRRRIESGELGEGERIPTEDQLMERYHASRNTVRAALKELSTRGLVDTQHGRGTFVSKRVSPIVTTLSSDPEKSENLVYTAEVEASGRSPSVDPPNVQIIKANSALARLLRIAEGADIILRHQKRYVDELPWSLQASYYPRSLQNRAPRLLDTDDMEEGTVTYMATCGIKQVGYQDAIEWRAPTEEETTYFSLPADGHIQVVEIRRVAFGQKEARVRLTVTVYRADRNRFVLNVGNVPNSEMY